MAETDGRDEGLQQDGANYVSGFVVKLYQMVNDAPDDVISVRMKLHATEPLLHKRALARKDGQLKADRLNFRNPNATCWKLISFWGCRNL